MNMSMKNILIRITLHLIHLKIQQQQQQHHLVLQKRLQLGQVYLQPVKKSLLKLPILQKCQQQNLLNTI